MVADTLPQSGIAEDDLGSAGLRQLFARALGSSDGDDRLAESVGNALFGLPDDVMGRYQLGAVLGAGGFGVVREGFDPLLRRPVAIKLLRRSCSGTRGDRVSPAREARSLARVRHPNVVEVFDVGIAEQGLYIVMQRVDGEPLDRWLARHPWLGPTALVALLHQAACGLAEIHRSGLLHCDFKPGNILVARDGAVKIVDFGLAELARDHDTITAGGEHERGHSPRPRLGAGTPLYMSPEQHQGLPLDAASDVYSFAVVLLEALLGSYPFRQRSLTGLLAAKQAEAFFDPRDIDGLAPAVARALGWALRADPRRRCPSIAVLLAGFAARPPGGTRARRIGLLAAGALALLGIAPVQDDARCAVDTAELMGAGSPWQERRAQLGDELGAGGPIEQAIIARVDDWGAHWSSARDGVCEGNPEHGARVRACLDDELAEFIAGLDALPRAPLDALASLAELPDPLRCRVPGDGARERDPALALVLRRGQLHLRNGDRSALADDIAELEAFEPSSDLHVQAVLEHWRSLAARHRGDFTAERAHLERTYQLAHSVRSDELAHRAALQLAAHHAVLGLDQARAHDWLRLADAIAPVELGAMLRARRLGVELRLSLRSGDYVRGLEVGSAARDELDRAGLASTPLAVEIGNGIVEAALALGRFDGLEARARAALVAAVEVGGEPSYEAAHARVSLGRLLVSIDRPDEARALLELARTRLIALGDRLLLPQVHNAIAHVLAQAGDLPRAIVSYQAAMDAFPADLHADRGLTLLNLAAAEIFAHQLDDGEAHLVRATAELDGVLDEGHPWRAHVADGHAKIALHRRRWADAARLCELAALAFERHYGATNWMAAEAWIDVANARLELGERIAALDALRRAERSEGAPPSLLANLAATRARADNKAERARKSAGHEPDVASPRRTASKAERARKSAGRRDQRSDR